VSFKRPPGGKILLRLADRLRSTRAVPDTARSMPPRHPPGRSIDARRRNPVVLPSLAAVLIAALYVVLLARLLPIGIDDLGIAAVFSTDEALSGRIVRAMLDNRTLSPQHFFAYGALYHELATLALVPFAWLDIGDRAVLLGLRAVSLAAGAATILLTYRLGARLSGPWTGVLAAALLACSAEMARWSITAHPDTLQLALIAGGLLAVVAVRDRASPGRVTVAALLAGLAFGTKYGGLFLLPLIVLAAACALVEQGSSGRPLLRRLALHAALAGAVFMLTFALTNPYALVEWRRFLTQFRAELDHARAGHVFAAGAGPWNWIRMVASPRGIGLTAFVTAATGWALLARGRATVPPGPLPWWRRLAARLDARALVALWTLGYLLYLVAFIGLQEPRYALPALPGLAVAAAAAVTHITAGAPRAAVTAGLALLALTFLPALRPLQDVYVDRMAQTADAENPRIAAGRWLAANVLPDAAVLVDAYVYVPPAFSRRTETFGLTVEQVQATRPVAIAVNDDIRGRFGDNTDADRYVDGADAFRQRAEAYAALEAGRLGCYRLIADFGPVRVYGDRGALNSGASHGCGAD
jgi:4-amino-4-deoxy-L-arabinose transferase-like glycosyltransferase